MKITGYLTITLWLAVLGGFLVFTYWSAQPGWAELTARLRSAPAGDSAKTFAASRVDLRNGLISETDRNRLTDGLASLTATLETYKNRLASGN